MSGKSAAGKVDGRNLNQLDCLRAHSQRHATKEEKSK